MAIRKGGQMKRRQKPVSTHFVRKRKIFNTTTGVGRVEHTLVKRPPVKRPKRKTGR